MLMLKKSVVLVSYATGLIWVKLAKRAICVSMGAFWGIE